jgi:hypothetical protein
MLGVRALRIARSELNGWPPYIIDFFTGDAFAIFVVLTTITFFPSARQTWGGRMTRSPSRHTLVCRVRAMHKFEFVKTTSPLYYKVSLWQAINFVVCISIPNHYCTVHSTTASVSTSYAAVHK